MEDITSNLIGWVFFAFGALVFGTIFADIISRKAWKGWRPDPAKRWHWVTWKDRDGTVYTSWERKVRDIERPDGTVTPLYERDDSRTFEGSFTPPRTPPRPDPPTPSTDPS